MSGKTNYIFTTGAIDALGESATDRRFFVIDADEFMRDTVKGSHELSEWARKSREEVYSDMEALANQWRKAHPEITSKWVYWDESPFYGQSGPPLRIPIAHQEPQFGRGETPRAIAKARAVAIFGPKRGRWK